MGSVGGNWPRELEVFRTTGGTAELRREIRTEQGMDRREWEQREAVCRALRDGSASILYHVERLLQKKLEQS